ncbi:MAG: restriction endonuclease subunit S [Marinobacter sp.]|uniref:restriction endonuclease subunit S n=1 Tax=Marinobacter sp. TaxID=50741 RepID=UPI003F98350B
MVPEGWIHTTFGRHIECLTGFAFKSNGYSNAEDDIRLLRGDNIIPGGLRWRDAKLWPKNETDGLEGYHLQDGDFVIALDRTWISNGLKVAEVTAADLPCLLVQRVARIRAKDSLEQSLLRQYFSGHRFEQYVKSVQTATAVPHISPNDIKEFTVPLPPLPEQKKIAQILSTWDQAITATERLLENSQQRKKGLMQQLLTGKKRLPGFEGEWESAQLGDLVEITSGSSKAKYIDQIGDKYIIDMGSVTRTGRLIPTKKTSLNGPYLAKGQLVMPKDDIGGGNIIGRVGVIPENEKYLLADHVYALTPHQTDSQFLGYLINSEKVNKSLRRRANGTAQLGLGKKDVQKQAVFIPSDPAEQRAIGEVLSSTDQEFDLLSQRLIMLKQEKTALMQQLLTGKRRVQVDTEAA